MCLFMVAHLLAKYNWLWPDSSSKVPELSDKTKRKMQLHPVYENLS